jgi:hypothetical protein
VGVNAITSTPVKLTTSKFSGTELNSGDAYTMSCKLIASNDAAPDHLHFTAATRLDIDPLGGSDDATHKFDSSTIGKILITAYGSITHKEIIRGMRPGEPTACVITLKSVDIDPTVSLTHNSSLHLRC